LRDYSKQTIPNYSTKQKTSNLIAKIVDLLEANGAVEVVTKRRHGHVLFDFSLMVDGVEVAYRVPIDAERTRDALRRNTKTRKSLSQAQLDDLEHAERVCLANTLALLDQTLTHIGLLGDDPDRYFMTWRLNEDRTATLFDAIKGGGDALSGFATTALPSGADMSVVDED
jgi:hypothetical protein